MKWEFYNKEKFQCPECGEYRFNRMINEEGIFYPDNVGRCDRENSCGYIYHASQWLKDNPNAKEMIKTNRVEQPKRTIIDGYYSFDEELWENIKSNDTRHRVKFKSQFNYSPEFRDYLINELQFTNDFIDQKMNQYKMSDSTQMYFEGDSRDSIKGKSFVNYFYYSFSKEIRAVERIYYEGFKRSHKNHNVILNQQYYNFGINGKKYDIYTTEINWCLFGEHLIGENTEKKVIVVEGVKTAFGMALYYPDYNWVATGSADRFGHAGVKNHLTPEQTDHLTPVKMVNPRRSKLTTP